MARAEILIEYKEVTAAREEVKKLKEEMQGMGRGGGGSGPEKVKQDMGEVAKKTQEAGGHALTLRGTLGRLALPAAMILALRELVAGLEKARTISAELAGKVSPGARVAGLSTVETTRMLRGASYYVGTEQAAGAFQTSFTKLRDVGKAQQVTEAAAQLSYLGEGGAGGIAGALSGAVRTQGVTDIGKFAAAARSRAASQGKSAEEYLQSLSDKQTGAEGRAQAAEMKALNDSMVNFRSTSLQDDASRLVSSDKVEARRLRQATLKGDVSQAAMEFEQGRALGELSPEELKLIYEARGIRKSGIAGRVGTAIGGLSETMDAGAALNNTVNPVFRVELSKPSGSASSGRN